ncbi:MAG TPA: hypothetical protein VH372_23375 [Actinospica sp.]|jgi:hypothetical protein|nr:hypothetical protein [Actinospica sp.]
MGFFDSLPAPEPPKPPRSTRLPEWHHPGSNVAPAALVVDGLLVHRPALAVFLNGIDVYPHGFTVGVTVLRRRVRGRRFGVHEDNPFGPHWLRGTEQVADPERYLRFGVQFADGRGASAQYGSRRSDRDSPPAQPYMTPHGGHGGVGDWEQNYWIWGLPEHGGVSLVYSWLAENVPESRFELGGDELRAAAGRAVRLWTEPDEDDVAGR